MNKIGFLDSGIGGLSVLETFSKQTKTRPQGEELNEIIYLADTANLPYGGKSLIELHEILRANLEWFDGQVETLILACNTSSAIFDEELQKEFPRMKIIGLIQSLADEIAANYKDLENIVVFSTQATHNSGAYIRSLQEVLPLTNVVSIPCPKLVPCIESQIVCGEEALTKEAKNIVAEYSQILNFKPAAIVFGCTHYAFAKEAFKAIFPQALLLDPAEAVITKITNLAIKEQTKFSAFASSETEKFEAKLNSLSNLLVCAKNFGLKVNLARTTTKRVESLKG